MFNNFSQEYKKLMLDTETSVKERGYTEILPQDVVLEISRISSGDVYELLATYGVNEKIIIEVFEQKAFASYFKGREGEYVGISKPLKEIIVSSVKIAASFEKKKADIFDFLLALLRSPKEIWFYQFFDFVGVNPKDIEQSLINANQKRGSGAGSDTMFGPLNNLLSSLEDGGEESNISWMDGGAPVNNPFANNKKPDNLKKSESATPALDFFGTDLTDEARRGKIDTIIGRDVEIERLISVLNRKTKNNPCLVGDPGVGKTAVVEGLALRIARGQVPLAMQNKRIMSLDLGGMIAGTKYRGEFEARIKQIIDEASKLENEVVLFIDEIHTIIGAGAGEGTLDAANILKPAMGRGKICVIGATTVNEYQKHIEKDSALERRFQKIEVPEPSEATTIEIITGLRESFENFHNLIIDDSTIEASVRLSTRYITDRFLPDKAIDLIDEACSTKSMKYNFDEEEIRSLREEVQKLQKNIESFVLEQQYHKAIKAKEKQTDLEKKIQERKSKRTIPREKRMHIDDTDIARVITHITNIPQNTLRLEEREKLRGMEKSLGRYIIGQDEAIASIVSSIRRSSVGITDKNRPIGSFLFFGPTGVGKTELVKVLAREYFGDESAMIKIDMSEYSDRSSASKLIGTTAGYVGYEEGGMLTEKVRRKPYSIVLFDEIEKGNFEIFNLLLQILEDGIITDGKGRKVNFKNTIVIMTSNIGSEEFTSKAAQIGFNVSDKKEEAIIADFERIREKIMGNMDEYFPPEFINRIDKLVFFNPIDKAVLRKIVLLQLDRLTERLRGIGIAAKFDTKSVNHILKETYNPNYGARPVRRYIQDHIEDAIANLMINQAVSDTVAVSAKSKHLTFNGKAVEKR